MAQPDFISIIKEKNQRIEDIPARLLSKTLIAEKQIFEGIIELLSQLEVKNGLFTQSVKNLEIAARINSQLKDVLLKSEYSRAVTEFAKQFDIQAELNFEYFNKAFELPAATEFAVAAVQMAKRNAVDLLVNRAAESDLIAPLKNVIEQAVVNNSSFADTVKAVRQFVETTPEADSRILRYTTLIARDSFAVSDAMVSSFYSDEVGAEWFLYSGALIDTSRAFCRERDGGYYHRKEVEAWGMGKKTMGMETPFSDGNWQGKSKGTNKTTIFAYRGGYNCGHTIMPVSVFSVPKTDIQRAIDQGFYEPTEKEAELLEL